MADEVNKREPATEWRSLGEIVKHLYVVKLRDDFDYDVLAFSNNISLENMAGTELDLLRAKAGDRWPDD